MGELPLVSVLIPAYNRPVLLELALNSVLRQSYPNIEIVICDDSTNDEVQQMMQPYLQQYNHIRYYKNEINLGSRNFAQCFAMATGSFINFLNDDDLFHEDKISKMMPYMLEDEDVVLVTSSRQMINDAGVPLGILSSFSENQRFDGRTYGNDLLRRCDNQIGEPTTVLFRKAALREPLYVYKGQTYVTIGDFASWVSLMTQGKAVYLSEVLSYFRIHPNQESNLLPYVAPAIKEWFDVIQSAREDGYLQDEVDYRTAIQHYLFVHHGISSLVLGGNRQDLLDKYHATELHQLASSLLAANP